MSSYISSFSMSSALRQAILTAQSNLVTAQQEVSTGRKMDVGLSLGATTGQSFSLRAETSLLQTISQTNNVASTRLASTQTILGQMQSGAQNFLDSLIAANSSTSGTAALQANAQSGLRSLIGNLNTSVSGQYIFGGINSGTAPVTDYFGSAAANKTAVDTAFLTTFGFSQSSPSVSSISGSQMQSFLDTTFANLFQGTNWTSDWSVASNTTMSSRISDSQTVSTSVSANQSAFQNLAQAYTMVADLGTQNLNSSALQAVSQTAMTLVQKAITGLTNIQANAGIVQSAVTTANDQMSMQMYILTTQVNNLESVDPYEAATRVTNLQTQIETSYSLTAQLQKLSLVRYI